MIMVTFIVGKKKTDAQRERAASANGDITTGTTVLLTQVDEVPVV